MGKQIQCPECKQIASASSEDNGDYRCVCGKRIPKSIGDQLASDGVLADVSISSWGGLIQKLRDKHGCILWIAPISSQETEKVIGWSFECEWLLYHHKVPNVYQDHIWHESANAAEEAAVKWACKELEITVSALADEC